MVEAFSGLRLPSIVRPMVTSRVSWAMGGAERTESMEIGDASKDDH